MAVLFYAVLKVEGDILIDLDKIDLAIKTFKCLKDQCDKWQGMDRLKMKTYEQIAVCYRMNEKNNLAIMYFKKALQYAYFLNDDIAEIAYYELIARSNMDAGQPQKMKQYHERAFTAILDPADGIGRLNAKMYLKSKKERIW